MSVSQIFRKVILPCAAGITASTNSENHTYGPNCTKKNEEGNETRPSDLPLYSKECLVCDPNAKPTPPPSTVEETVGNIRRELWVWQDSLKGYRHKIVEVYRQGFSKAGSAIDYLREPAHGPERMGAIAISGVAGYILGMRGGKFRRIMYGFCGALGMAAICYPDEAAEYLEAVVLEGRRYFIIAYHFLYGESPEMPKWLEGFVGNVKPQEVKGVEKAETENNKEIPFDLKKIMPNDDAAKKKS